MSDELDQRLRGLPINELRQQCRARGLSPAGDQYALRDRVKENMMGTGDFNLGSGGGGGGPPPSDGSYGGGPPGGGYGGGQQYGGGGPPGGGGYGQQYGGAPGGDLPYSRGAISQMNPGPGRPGSGPGYGQDPYSAGGPPPSGNPYGQGGPPPPAENPWARAPHSEGGGAPPGGPYGGPPPGAQQPYGGSSTRGAGPPPMDVPGAGGPQYGRRASSRERHGQEGPPVNMFGGGNVGGNNYNRPSGSQNVGNYISDRPTSRVLAPPGGVSQISFGSSDAPTPPRQAPRSQGGPYDGAPPPYGTSQNYGGGGGGGPSGMPPRSVGGGMQSSSQAYGSGSRDHVEGHVMNNYSRPGGMQNVGNFITDRPSSKVLAPPGGKSSISFGAM